MKVWITKYALTKGIIEINAEIDGHYAHGRLSNGRRICTRQFTKTRAAAVAAADEVRGRKLAALRKQIAKLERMKF